MPTKVGASCKGQGERFMDSGLTIVGDDSRGGAYLLRIVVLESVAVRFGRFMAGTAVSIPAGEYLYIGSAMGQRGSSSLARRLLRHATRSGKRPFHPIRTKMQAEFVQAGLADAPLSLPQQKKRHWHIDYLLDELNVHLQHAFAFRSLQRLETLFARALLADSATYILENGLGASDDPGGTHLLGVTACTERQPELQVEVAVSGWWESLPNYLLRLQQNIHATK